MTLYAINNLTERQLDMIWFGLYFLREYVKGSPSRAELFGSDDEIVEVMTRALHGEADRMPRSKKR